MGIVMLSLGDRHQRCTAQLSNQRSIKSEKTRIKSTLVASSYSTGRV